MMSEGHDGHKGHDGHDGITYFEGIQTFILRVLNVLPIRVKRLPGSPNQDHRSAIIASGRYVRYSKGEKL